LRIAEITGTKLRPLRVKRYSTLGGTTPKPLRSINPGRGERLQFAAEDPRRNFAAACGAPRKAGLDLAAALRAVLKIPDDPKLVFSADHLLKRRHRATTGRR
jgi:hypothetical protein